MADSDAPPQRVPIKEHFEAILSEKDKRYEQRFDAQEKAVNAALTAAKEAVLKAEAAAEKRFESVNEFRQTLTDQAGTFMPRKEAENEIKTAYSKIDDLQRRMDRNEGRSSGLGAGWVYLLGAIGAIGIIYGFMNGKVERNTARVEQAVPIPVTAPAPLPVKPVKETP